MSAIELHHIVKSFGTAENRVQVLHDVSLSLPTGEMTLMVGPSGCGKTTLISILAGILRADRGEIHLFGQPIHQMNDLQKATFRQKNVGFVFQQGPLK
jgi:putative ABC transport system ATP-binding protein